MGQGYAGEARLITRDTMIALLSVASLIMFVASFVLVPWLLVRLPADYFMRPKPHLVAKIRLGSPLAACGLVAKNCAGVAVIIAGILMLVLPGQGLLTIIIGVMLVDFPGKYRIERRLVQSPKVLRAINWLREKAGKAALIL